MLTTLNLSKACDACKDFLDSIEDGASVDVTGRFCARLHGQIDFLIGEYQARQIEAEDVAEDVGLALTSFHIRDRYPQDVLDHVCDLIGDSLEDYRLPDPSDFDYGFGY